MNEAPTISPTTKSESLPQYSTYLTGTTNASDVDTGTTLTYTITSQTGTYGTLDISSNTGNWRYDLSSNSSAFKALGNGVTGYDTITIDVTDSLLSATTPQTLIITVTGTNSAPQFTSASTFSITNYSISKIAQIIATDPEINPLTYSIVSEIGDASTFNIDTTSGEITFKTPTIKIKTYTLRIGVTDTYSGLQTQDISLNVHYGAAQLKTTYSKTATDLKTALYPASELKTAGYLASDLYTAGYSVQNLIDVLYTDQQIIQSGFTESQLKANSRYANAPAAPVITNIVPGNGSATINFTPAVDPSNTITKWYQYSIDNGGNYLNTSSSANSIVITSGLTNDTSYNFKIRATNYNVILGTASASMSATPHPPTTVTTSLMGKAVDGYIKFGTITIKDLSGNRIKDSSGVNIPTVTTDEFGNYSIPITMSTTNPTSYIIECTGGRDIATDLSLNYPLTAIYTPSITNYSVTNISNITVTPLTTIVANIVKAVGITAGSSTQAISDAVASATTKVALALDISSNLVNTDYIATSNILVTAAAVKIATITNIISTTESKSATTVLLNISTIIQEASTKITINNAFVQAAGGQTPIANLTNLITDVVTTIDASGSTITSIYKTSIGGTTVAASPITSYTTGTLTTAISTATVGVLSNICFKAGTKVVTDQGIVNIEKITTENSIRGKKVLFVSKTTNIDNYLIKIEKGALYENVPNTDTWLTGEHKVFYNKAMIKAKNLVNGKTIVREKIINEVVYNLLLEGEKEGKMIANGMISETLDPRSLMVEMLIKLSKLSEPERARKTKEINKGMLLEHSRRK